MTKAELESKSLSELHSLAAEAGVSKFRMLSRSELIGALSDGEGDDSAAGAAGASGRERGSERGERPARQRRRRGSGSGRGGGRGGGRGTGDELGDEAYGGDSKAVRKGEDEEHPVAPGLPEAEAEEAEPARRDRPASAAAASEPARPKRRRRRRFGRRSKEGITIQDLLLPAEAGRQAILAAEGREACTALLRGVAADLATASKGPDPVVLLIDPGPEELADWKREAPQAEIVAAGQARHASDVLAQAAARAGSGEDVMLLVDSLTRLAGDFADTDTAKEFFDAGRAQGSAGGGSLTIVAAIERS